MAPNAHYSPAPSSILHKVLWWAFPSRIHRSSPRPSGDKKQILYAIKKNIKELKYRVAPWSRNSLYIVFPKGQNSGTTCYSCKHTPRDLASWEMIKSRDGSRASQTQHGQQWLWKQGKQMACETISFERWNWGANCWLPANKKSKQEKYMFIKRNHYKTLLKLGLLTKLYNKSEKIYNIVIFSYRKDRK